VRCPLSHLALTSLIRDLTMRLEGGEIRLFAGICWYAHVFHRFK
jgi:hypothetical protein